MRTFNLPSGRTLQLEDSDFRSLLHSNREEVLKQLGVRRRPGFVLEATEDGESCSVRLEGSGERREAAEEPEA